MARAAYLQSSSSVHLDCGKLCLQVFLYGGSLETGKILKPKNR